MVIFVVTKDLSIYEIGERNKSIILLLFDLKRVFILFKGYFRLNILNDGGIN